jgi:hypothetical protein
MHVTQRVFLTRATRRNIPEDTILHSHRCETSNLRYIYVLSKHKAKERCAVLIRLLIGLVTAKGGKNTIHLELKLFSNDNQESNPLPAGTAVLPYQRQLMQLHGTEVPTLPT